MSTTTQKPSNVTAKFTVSTTAPVVNFPSIIKKDLPPLDERLHRLNQLFEVQTKYNRLQDSKQKLNEFKLKKDAETVSLTLSDYNSRSTEFTTKNPVLIKDIIEFLKTTIDAKIKEVEPQLFW